MAVKGGRSPLDEARAALAAGDWASARSVLAAAITDDPDPELLHLLARAEEWAADYRAAIMRYEAAFTAYRGRGQARTPALIAGRELAFLHAAVYGHHAVAEGWLARAHRLLRDCGDCVERGWIALADALSAPDPRRMGACAREAAAVADRFGDPDLGFCAMGYEGTALVLTGNITDGMRLVDEAATAATNGEVGDYLAIGEIYCKMLLCCELTLDVARAQQWLHVASGFGRAVNAPWVSAICRTYYGGILTAAGRWREAESELTASLRRYDESYRALRSGAVVRLADLRVRQGKWEEAARLLAGYEFDAFAVRPIARLRFLRGDLDGASTILRRFLATAGDEAIRAPEIALLAEVETKAGRLERARELCGRLNEIATRTGAPHVRGLADYVAGLTSAAGNARDEALEHLETALPAFSIAGLRLEAARTRMAIARLRAAEHADLAVTEARDALADFEELAATVDADDAAAFLRTLGEAGRPRPRVPGTLTKREREVLDLVAEGLSNEGIAARLFLSKRTVEHHVSNLLDKLGVDSLAEAVARAWRHNPADRNSPF